MVSKLCLPCWQGHVWRSLLSQPDPYGSRKVSPLPHAGSGKCFLPARALCYFSEEKAAASREPLRAFSCALHALGHLSACALGTCCTPARAKQSPAELAATLCAPLFVLCSSAKLLTHFLRVIGARWLKAHPG